MFFPNTNLDSVFCVLQRHSFKVMYVATIVAKKVL